MNNFDDENRIEKDEPVNAVGGNYNPDNNTGLENGDAAETSDITGEAAMENIRWGFTKQYEKKRKRCLKYSSDRSYFRQRNYPRGYIYLLTRYT